MTLKSKFALSLISVAALAGCNKSANDIKNDIDRGANKAASTGQWTSPCLDMSVAWDLAGLSSQTVTYDFYANAGKTVKLFGKDNCQAAKAEITYSGDSHIGDDNAQGNNTIDLNFNKVEVKITDQATVDLLNGLAPSCGINDWKLNEPRDVTTVAGSGTCLMIGKAQPIYDIIKTGGSFIKFGLATAELDRSTPDRRPAVIDDSIVYKH